MDNSNDKKRKFQRGFTSFVKAETIGICPFCNKDVFNDQLYVKEEEKAYHYSCHNYMKAEEDIE